MRTAVIVSILILVTLLAAVVIRFATTGTEGDGKTEAKSHWDTADDPKGKITANTRWDVPEVLEEISGIDYLEINRFACIQDEAGKVFIYNTAEKKIEKEISFGESGDYEDLAVAGKSIFVLRADGRLFEIRNYQESSPEIREHNAQLSGYDSEGLCYDRKGNRLLLAVKELKGDQDQNKRPVYAFDLQSRKISGRPVFQIDLTHNIFKDLDEKKTSNRLKPSAIEIHSQTGDIYLLEGAKPKLLILDPAGQPKALHDLKGKDFKQPEGMAFSPEGTLFICSEGSKNNAGNIVQVSAW